MNENYQVGEEKNGSSTFSNIGQTFPLFRRLVNHLLRGIVQPTF